MASEVPWPDGLLVDAAARLSAAGDSVAAEAMVSFSELTLRYGSSWWDGHDDYVYDVELALVTDPAGLPPLAAAGQAVPAAFATSVGTFVDESGELRRGDLVAFEALVGPVTLDRGRLAGRRWDMTERLRVVGG